MGLLKGVFSTRPTAVRVFPFVIFAALTSLQAVKSFEPAGTYWIYLFKTVVGAWLVLEMWDVVSEMRWAFSWEAVLIGVAVFLVWVGLDSIVPSLSELFHIMGFADKPTAAAPWNPHLHFDPVMAWMFVAVRIIGSSLIVPPLEEVFYRSFLYRYVATPKYLEMPLGKFHLRAFIMVALFFGLAHPDQWLAGILCAAAYQWLVVRKNRLGDAMTAHAITNLLLGIWVVSRGAWKFW